MRKFGFVLAILFLSKLSYGQEILLDLQTLPIKSVESNRLKAKAKTSSLLQLPFFDDFSRGLSYPDRTNWADSYVLVNQTFAINPPTIGVATFDAIDNKGELYSQLSTTSLPADTLTSNPIDLNYPEADSLYISFKYQAKGLGKEPQINDSLVLEFYAVDENKWIGAWAASADFSSNIMLEKNKIRGTVIERESKTLSDTFFTALVPIIDEKYRKSGFRFRFVNYASLSPNLQVPSIRGNGDHWHIDMVNLDRNRYYQDTLCNDIAFSKPIKSLLNNYQSIPWKHLSYEAKQAELLNPLSFTTQYVNLGTTTWNVTRRYIVSDLSSYNSPVLFSGGADNIYSLETFDYTRNYEYELNSNWADSAKFELESYLITDIDPNTHHLRYNDTIRYTQQFHNYYAYDDGSAENGYGIYGEGSQNGMVAVKFHSYVEDSLKGIYIYFNRAYKDANQVYFKLTVWDDVNGLPGDTLYQKTNIKPIFRDDLNKFTLYSVDRLIKINGDFWVGWENTTTDMLNVGFDRNSIHNDKLYYNITGSWAKSQFEGSLMIRPVFGKLTENPTSIDTPKSKVDFSIYPNPATSQVNIDIDEKVKPETIRIVNLSGQVMLSKHYDGSSIDVSNLPTGVYLLQVTLYNKATSTKKLVIIK